jgi:hypothetical protein
LSVLEQPSESQEQPSTDEDRKFPLRPVLAPLSVSQFPLASTLWEHVGCKKLLSALALEIMQYLQVETAGDKYFYKPVDVFKVRFDSVSVFFFLLSFTILDLFFRPLKKEMSPKPFSLIL